MKTKYYKVTFENGAAMYIDADSKRDAVRLAYQWKKQAHYEFKTDLYRGLVCKVEIIERDKEVSDV